MQSRHRLGLAVASVLGVLAFPSTAQTAEADGLTLKPSPELGPPGLPRGAPIIPGVPAKPPAPGTKPAAAPPEERAALFLRADRMEGDERRVEASGSVELRMRRETVLADRITYDVLTDEIHAEGNVTLRRGVDTITGPEVRFKRSDETGFFAEPRFLVGETGARGNASRLSFLGENHYEATDARYTTCVAPREDWFLETRELNIDNDRKVGTAYDTTLRFFGRPIFYSPWLEFPLTNERKSGFLTPTVGSTAVRGFELALPYYLNLAPNYDATITPRYMTRRGLQLGGQFRYIFDDPQTMSGEANVELLPHDRRTDTNRWFVSTRHSQQLAPWLTGYWNVNKVSDDKYFADLADRVQATSQTTLPREAGLNAVWKNLAVVTRVQGFQTLQDPNAPIVPPYNRLPQVLATLSESEWGGLEWTGSAEYVSFRQPQLVQGDRLVLYPVATWLRQGPAWFLAARGSVHMRQYVLDNVSPGSERSPTVTVPIASVDGGLTFERDWNAFGNRFVQTLEPRAFYVYIPYRNQDRLPVFDTTADDFSFSQLFNENRYIGNDRIGDASQLTLALTSRLLDAASGAERLRTTIGQRYYFREQRVTLPNEAPRSASSSDVLLGVEGRLSEQWAINGLLQTNTQHMTTERLNLGMRWSPSPGKALNAVYRFTSQRSDPFNTPLRQFDVSTEWPIGGRWTALARWNYSLADRKTLEALAGFEYNADCWVLRVVLHRLATTTQQTNTAVYVQLEFSGLARVGTNPLEVLQRSIPGYLRSNDPARQTDTGIVPYPEL